jgi:perosamine synthetase
VDQDDIQAVVSVLQGDWLTTGPAVPALEEAFAQRVGARHAVAVCNGTAALHAAMHAAGIGEGDEVIVPALTFAATANAVLYQGGTPVFVDVLPDTLNVDPDAVAGALTVRTRAIASVDYAGQPADYGALRDIAQRRGLRFLSDSAHALGARWKDQPVGAIADLTTFSLHPVKHVTAGEGGVITTNDGALAARMRTFRNHGITSDHRQREAAGSWVYEMVDLGFNYRLTDIQCALATSQLGKLEEWLRRRRAIAARYHRLLGVFPELELPVVAPDVDPAWHLYVVRLRLERLAADRREIFQALRAENIGVNVHYIPVPWHPYYQQRGWKKGCWPVAEAAYERILSLPMFPGMSDADVDTVVFAVEKVIRRFRT